MATAMAMATGVAMAMAMATAMATAIFVCETQEFFFDSGGFWCGFNNANKDKASLIDEILEYIAQFAPGVLWKRITEDSTSIDNAFDRCRKWAGLQNIGSALQSYIEIKDSWNENGDVSANDFYYQMQSALEDALLLSEANGGKIKFEGKIPDNNEVMSGTMESLVVADWIQIIGGKPLLLHVFQQFNKELQTETLADIRQTIIDNLERYSQFSTELIHALL